MLLLFVFFVVHFPILYIWKRYFIFIFLFPSLAASCFRMGPYSALSSPFQCVGPSSSCLCASARLLPSWTGREGAVSLGFSLGISLGFS